MTTREHEPAQELDTLLDCAPCGFVSFADDGAVRAANSTLLEMLGYSRDAVIGQHVERLLTVGGRIFYQTHLFPVLRLHGRADEIFILLRASDGSDVGALVNAVRRERGAEWITDCVLLRVHERRKFEDALLRAKEAAETARRQAEAAAHELSMANATLEEQAVELEVGQQQLSEQAEELEVQSEELHALNDELVLQAEELAWQRGLAEDANKAKSAFLASMSHELRTPLNAIGGYVQLMEMGIHGPLTAEQEASLVKIGRAQRHLLRLINEILNLSRIEAGTVHYDLKRTSVREIAEAVLPLVEPQMRERALSCTNDVPADLFVCADREKTEQVLLNLLGNAVKFTERGGTIAIRAGIDPSAPQRARIEVRDSGIGIPEDYLLKVFEPFVQVQVDHARRAEGTGLGLAISRDLARGMGGDLTATSVVGQGSTFSLILPRD